MECYENKMNHFEIKFHNFFKFPCFKTKNQNFKMLEVIKENTKFSKSFKNIHE